MKKILKNLFTIVGMLLGYSTAEFILKIDRLEKIFFWEHTIYRVLFIIAVIILFGFIFYILTPIVYKRVNRFIEFIVRRIQRKNINEIVYGSFGAIIFLMITTLITRPLLVFHSTVGKLLLIIINIISAIIGAELMAKKKNDLTSFIVNIRKNSQTKDKKNKGIVKGVPKVLDTSVIVDGRIFDICKTGFIEGPLVIPEFVLDELRHISDSSDDLKRARGRRGLDILNKIQKELSIEVEVWNGEIKEIDEVDSKLLKLAKMLKGKVITNDYNLNKVAEVQGVPVLNINDLSNAIKPILIPGESMVVELVRVGKGNNQGIAYLDDGTMIVVEEGRKYIGKAIEVVVTSVLQKSAGRMIFGKPIKVKE